MESYILALVYRTPANRRPCSNCASESISPPFSLPPCPCPPFPFPFPSFPLSTLSPPRRRSGPLKQAIGAGKRCKLPSAAVAFCCIVCLQNASGCSISGSLVSIAMSGKMKANRLQGQNGGPLKSAALFDRTPRTCLRPALVINYHHHHQERVCCESFPSTMHGQQQALDSGASSNSMPSCLISIIMT